MKTRTKTSFATIAGFVALCVAMLVGCSKNKPSDALTYPRAIHLNAGLQVTAKAPVNDGVNFVAAVAGWESATGADYGVQRTWQSTSTITASTATAEITLVDPQYYNQDNATKTYIKAWHPEGTLSDDGIVAFGGAQDGTVDVLLSGETYGSALDAAGKTMIFNHQLTQLKFTVQGDALFGTTTTVKSITIKDAKVPTGIDLKLNAVTYTTTGLKAPGVDGSQAITTTETSVGQPLMICPFEQNTFMIDVQTSDVTYRDVVVTVNDSSLKVSKAYTISLTFAGFEITTQASVTQWDNTGTGMGDVTID